MAAVGYAKFTGRLGVCAATAGPGAIHLANGLLDARLEGVPLLAITGMTYHDLIGTHYLQDFDTDHLYANLAIYNQRIMGSEHVTNVVDLACRTALSRRGPAHLAFPIDYQTADASDIIAAEKLTERTMALLIRECSGIVCLCLTRYRLRQLDLPPMVHKNESRYGTAFTVSIEARDGVTTGVSAADRLTTVRAAIADDAVPADLVRPGHIFPIGAVENGVLARRGHTEGAVDLAWLAGLKPAAVLCELMNPDGTMAKGADVLLFAEEHGFPVLTIADIVLYRRGRP